VVGRARTWSILDGNAAIFGERDPARLTRWLTRAASCASAAELLALA
jgi:hypothetical protein